MGTEEELFPEGREKFFADNEIFTTLEEAEAEAAKRNNAVLRNLQNQFGNEVARTQQTFQTTAVNNQLQPSLNNQFQQQAAPIQQSSRVPSRINTAQNSFSLLNTNNFQAFDAQFGGAVPSNPGAANLNSNIFSRPQIQTPSQPQQPRFQPQPV